MSLIKELTGSETQDTLVIEDDCLSPREGERCMLHVEDEVYVVAKNYDDRLQIHIRQFTIYDDKIYPTKKGITLFLCRWRPL